MHPETLLQATSDGRSFVSCLREQNVRAGVKVDLGLAPVEGGREGETRTKGLEGLADRCKAYVEQGATFAKWRAALPVADGGISPAALEANAGELAEYAAVCQGAGLVPIVEPEILVQGDHDIGTFGRVTSQVLDAVFAALAARSVDLAATLLKPQMVISGSGCAAPKPAAREIAAASLATFRAHVPAEVAGIVFLSGGQSEKEATENLNEINAQAAAEGGMPWSLTFSFGRGLQASVLRTWAGKPENADTARKMMAAVAAANGAAALGKYQGPHPSLDTGSLVEGFRGHAGGAPAPPQ